MTRTRNRGGAPSVESRGVIGRGASVWLFNRRRVRIQSVCNIKNPLFLRELTGPSRFTEKDHPLQQNCCV
jgi:hypothetical protein